MTYERLLPTVSVCGNYNRKGASKTSGDGLDTAIRKLLPTPTSDDAGNATRQSGNFQSPTRQVLISSPEASPASLSVQPGSDEARMMTAGSGLRCFASFGRFSQLGSLAKMLLASSAWASTIVYLTWKKRVTPARRLLFQLAPSMPSTEGTGFSLLPTPSAEDNPDRGGTHNPAIQRRMKIGKQIELSMMIQDGTGRLSAEWVTWMMGFPQGWLHDSPIGAAADGQNPQGSKTPSRDE